MGTLGGDTLASLKSKTGGDVGFQLEDDEKSLEGTEGDRNDSSLVNFGILNKEQAEKVSQQAEKISKAEAGYEDDFETNNL